MVGKLQVSWSRWNTVHCFHSDGQLVGDGEIDSLFVDLGEDNEQDVAEALDDMINRAKRNGLRDKERLRTIVSKRKKDFRLKLGNSPPAKVKPIEIRLRPDVFPVKSKARRYSPKQREFIDSYKNNLVELDMAEERPPASWQSAPLAILKPGTKDLFRMAVDLRTLNAATVQEDWPKPHLESEVTDFAGSKFYSSIDFLASYWQLALDRNSYDICEIATPQRVVVSKHELQGLINSKAHFQSSVEPLFQELRPWMKACLDDFNLHCRTEGELLDNLDRFLEICEVHGLFLSARKYELFIKKIKWCGRVVSEDGCRLYPHRLSGIQNLHEPESGSELAEFIYYCRWMSLTIPDFVRIAKPLTELLERAFRKIGKRTKRSIKNIRVSTLSWGRDHSQAYEKIQEMLKTL